MSKTIKNVTYDLNNKLISCLFCNIVNRSEPSTLFYEDNKYMAFRNIAPIAPCHLLVIPKQHIRNLEELEAMTGPADNNNSNSPLPLNITILQEMKGVADSAYKNWKISNKISSNDENVYDESISYCFHVPPYNSVDHLHMHVIAGPRVSWLSAIKYNDVYTFWCHSYDTILTRLRCQLK